MTSPATPAADSTLVTTPHSPRRSPDPDERIETPRAPWSQVGPDFIRTWGYADGTFEPEHLEILGATGSGKSFFERTILLQRVRARGSHVVIICTKRADRTIQALHDEWEWPIIDHWPPDYGKHQVIFWARARGISKAATTQQRDKISRLLDQLWKPDSNIIVVFDEIFYVQHDLGLEHEVVSYLREGRSNGITVVAMTQRAQGLTRFMHSESAWTAAFNYKDDDDRERVAQILGNKRAYMPILESLDRSKHELLLVHNITNQKVITWVDKKAIPAPPRR